MSSILFNLRCFANNGRGETELARQFVPFLATCITSQQGHDSSKGLSSHLLSTSGRRLMGGALPWFCHASIMDNRRSLSCIPIGSKVDELDPRADVCVAGYNSIVVFHYILQIPGRRERDVSPPHPSCEHESVNNGVVSLVSDVLAYSCHYTSEMFILSLVSFRCP
jgi:hypothetical protein